MTPDAAYPAWLAQYEPLVPLPELIERANAIFHDIEAPRYDQRHPQVEGEWVALWQQLVEVALQQNPQRRWRILDYGCGTGFASLQLLRFLPADSVESITCFDLSPKMLEQCRAKVRPVRPDARFCLDLQDLPARGPFNLLATNSLLHHLPDPHGVVKELARSMTPDALWLSGIEPNRRFVRNTDCARNWNEYRRAARQQHSARRFFSPGYWATKLNKLVSHGPSPRKLTARRAVEEGLFAKLPSPAVIDRLVDYHIARSADDVTADAGFDPEQLRDDLATHWRREWITSWAYMGQTPEADLPPQWQTACDELKAKYPLDGAYFASVWRRAA